MPAELVVYANMRRKPQNLTHSIPSSRAGDRGGGGGGVGRGTSRPSAISNNRRPRDHRHLMAMVVSTLPLALLLLLVQTTGKSWPEAGTVRGEGQWHAQQKNFTCIQLINWTLIVRPVPADNFHGFKQSGRMKVEIKPRSCVDICIVFSIDAKLTGFVLIGSCPIGWEGIWKSNALLCNKNPLHLAVIWIESSYFSRTSASSKRISRTCSECILSQISICFHRGFCSSEHLVITSEQLFPHVSIILIFNLIHFWGMLVHKKQKIRKNSPDVPALDEDASVSQRHSSPALVRDCSSHFRLLAFRKLAFAA